MNENRIVCSVGWDFMRVKIFIFSLQILCLTMVLSCTNDEGPSNNTNDDDQSGKDEGECDPTDGGPAYEECFQYKTSCLKTKTADAANSCCPYTTNFLDQISNNNGTNCLELYWKTYYFCLNKNPCDPYGLDISQKCEDEAVLAAEDCN